MRIPKIAPQKLPQKPSFTPPQQRTPGTLGSDYAFITVAHLRRARKILAARPKAESVEAAEEAEHG